MTKEGLNRLRQDTGCDPAIAAQFLEDCLPTKRAARDFFGKGLRHEIPTDYQVKFLYRYLAQRLNSPVKYDAKLKRFTMLDGERVTKYAKRNANLLGLDDRKLCALGDLVNVRSLVITASPLDMLYASEEAAFLTCYQFKGQYASSALAMAQTPNMLMAYMTDNPSDDLGVIDYRHGRCWLHVEGEIVTTFSAYGAMTPVHKKLVREYVQDTISDSTTKWRVKHNVSHNGCGDHLVYLDAADVSVYNSEKGCFYSINHIEFPDEVVCLRCGVSHSGSNLFCEDCTVFCAMCGDVIVSSERTQLCDYCREDQAGTLRYRWS